jgi:hypothetical protein
VSGAPDEAIAALEDYLRRYPSGHFAELAQARLDKFLAQRGEKKIAIPVDAANPYSKGTLLADTDFRIGDTHELRMGDAHTGLFKPLKRTVTALTDLEVAYDDGLVTDLLGNATRQPNGTRQVDVQTFPAEYSVGKRWISRFKQYGVGGGSDEVKVDWTIVGREPVETLAGRFDAFRVEGSGWAFKGGRRTFRYWAAPDRVRRFVIFEAWRWDIRGAPARSERNELVSFHEASRAR